jgi:glutathione S-transferase
VRRVLAAAALAGVTLDYDSSFTFKSDWKNAEFLEKFPLGYLPALEDGDLYLSESGAIAEYGELLFPYRPDLLRLFARESWARGERGARSKQRKGRANVCRGVFHDENLLFQLSLS